MQDVMKYLMQFISRKEQLEKTAKIAGGILAGVLAVVLLVKLIGWAKVARENRQWIAVNNLTPDRLIARCGQPLEDKTENLSLIFRRDLSYSARDSKTVVFAFTSRADEPNNWVFMSMKDPQGVTTYDTPISKISALPCLDSRK